MISLKNTFYEDKEMYDIVIQYYLIKRNPIKQHKPIISFNFITSDAFIPLLSRKTVLSSNSSLKVMHVLEKGYTENATVGVIYTNFSVVL